MAGAAGRLRRIWGGKVAIGFMKDRYETGVESAELLDGCSREGVRSLRRGSAVESTKLSGGCLRKGEASLRSGALALCAVEWELDEGVVESVEALGGCLRKGAGSL